MKKKILKHFFSERYCLVDCMFMGTAGVLLMHGSGTGALLTMILGISLSFFGKRELDE